MAIREIFPKNPLAFIRFRAISGATLADLPVTENGQPVISPPAAPSDFAMVPNGVGQLDATITSNSGGDELGFIWEVSKTSDFAIIEDDGTTGTGVTNFSFTGLDNATLYYGRARGFSDVEGANSNIGTATTLAAFTFQTTNTGASDFEPQITDTLGSGLLDSDVKWIFENSYEVFGKTPTISSGDSGLDGSNQTVTVEITNIEKVDRIEISNERVTGALDLNIFPSLKSVLFPLNQITSVQMGDVELLDDASIAFNTNSSLSSLVIDTSYSIVVDQLLLYSTDLNSFDRGNFIFDASNVLINNTDIDDFETKSSDTFTDLNVTNCDLTNATFNPAHIDMVGSAATLYIQNNTSLNLNTLPTSFTGDLRLINLNNCIRVGNFSLAGYTWGSTQDIQILNFPAITSITPPVGATACTRFYTYGCTSISSLNLSSVSGSSFNIQTYGCSNLSSITPPSTPSVIRSFDVNGCNLTGSLNFSAHTFSGSVFVQINLQDNGLLTSFSMGAQTATYRIINFANTGITNFSSIISQFLAQPVGGVTPILNFQGCGMSTTQVNSTLSQLDAKLTSALVAGTSINIAGSNAAPTGGASNANVVSLVSKGFIVTLTP